MYNFEMTAEQKYEHCKGDKEDKEDKEEDKEDKEDEDKEDKEEDDDKCCYVFKKGSKNGSTCGEKICKISKKYCRTHERIESKEVKEVKEPKVKEIKIEKSKFNNLIHVATRYVFNTEKKVIGKENDKGKITKLSSDDLSALKKLRFKVDESCL